MIAHCRYCLAWIDNKLHPYVLCARCTALTPDALTAEMLAEMGIPVGEIVPDAPVVSPDFPGQA